MVRLRWWIVTALFTIGARSLFAQSSGWTNLGPLPGARVIYVSSSTGSDANDGLSAATAVRSLAAGYDLLRDGHPDLMVLRCGDVWDERLPDWQKSANSTSSYMAVGSFGIGPRPRVNSGQYAGFNSLTFVPRRGMAVTGVHFSSGGKGLGEDAGIQFIGDWGHVLVEDCFIERYKDNVIALPLTQGTRLKDVKVRRSVIVDSYFTGIGHSQGIYLGSCDDWLIEDCVLDSNGGGEATIFRHNVYVHESCGPGTFRGNISARSCSHGLQQRPGGLCENNLMLRDSLGILIGRSDYAPTSSNIVRYNVVLDGHDIDPTNPRAVGIEVSDVTQAAIERNIVAHQHTGTGNIAALRVTRSNNVTIRDNVVYDWTLPGSGWGRGLDWNGGCGGSNLIRGNRFQQPRGGMVVVQDFDSPYNPGFVYASNHYFSINPLDGYLWFVNGTTFLSNGQWQALAGEVGSTFGSATFPDTRRTIESYAKFLGAKASLESFMAQARLQSRQYWRTEFTAAGANRWFRQGYAVFCAVDFNQNGTFDSADYSAFTAAFQQSDPRADLNGDGMFNILDFVAFNSLAGQGCP